MRTSGVSSSASPAAGANLWRALLVAVLALAGLFASDIRINGAARAQPVRDAGTSELRVDLPMSAPIWRGAIAPDESFIVTGSPAKTAVLWDAGTLAPKRTFRVPLRSEQRRRNHPVAISPDGRLIAYGVPPQANAADETVIGTARIYIFDRSRDDETAIVKILEPPSGAISLQFSPDGEALAATLYAGCSVEVWSARDWSRMPLGAAARPGGSTCCSGTDIAPATCQRLPSEDGIAFPPQQGADDPWLVTAGEGGVRSYVRQGGRLELRANLTPSQIGLVEPAGLALHPDGRLLAVGDGKAPRVAVLELPSLAVAARMEIRRRDLMPEDPAAAPTLLVPSADGAPPQYRAWLGRVSWSRVAGKDRIIAGGFLLCGHIRPELWSREVRSHDRDFAFNHVNCMLNWSWDDREAAPTTLDAGTDTVMSLERAPRTGRVLLATQRDIRILEPDGSTASTPRRLAVENPGVDFRRLARDEGQGVTVDAREFLISDDARVLTVEDYRRTDGDGKPVRLLFALDPVNGQSLRFSRIDRHPLAAKVSAGTRDQGGDVVRHWYTTPTVERGPEINGNVVRDPRLDPRDISRAVAVQRDSSGRARMVLWGSSNFIRLVDGEARIQCQHRIDAEAYRVAITPDGRIAVVGHADGIVRWYAIARQPNRGCDLQLYLSLFIHRDGGGGWRWHAWTPDGKYDGNASRAAAGWLHFDPNDRIEPPPRVRFRAIDQDDTNFDPAHIGNALPVGPQPRIVGDRGPAAHLTPLAERIAMAQQQRAEESISAPEITALSPVERRTIRDRPQQIEIDVRAANGAPDGTRLARPVPVTLTIGPTAVAFQLNDDPVARLDARIETSGRFRLSFDIPEAVLSEENGRDLDIVARLAMPVPRILKFERRWTGAMIPLPRRLNAVIVGISHYGAPELTLRYAHNDAIDLAHLLVRDLEAGRAAFAEMRIQLFVSARPESRAEIDTLRAKPYVTVHELGAAGPGGRTTTIANRDIEGALRSLARLEPITGGKLNVGMFFFAGHGMTEVINRTTSELKYYLLLPDYVPREPSTRLDQAYEVMFVDQTISDQDLLQRLDDIKYEMLIVIDACRKSYRNRTVAQSQQSETRHQRLDLNGFKERMKSRLRSATMFLAAGAEEEAFESALVNFEDEWREQAQRDFYASPRAAPGRGNGLFTASFLRGLINPATNVQPDGDDVVDDIEIARSIDAFLGPNTRSSKVQSVLDTVGWADLRPTHWRWTDRPLALRRTR